MKFETNVELNTIELLQLETSSLQRSCDILYLVEHDVEAETEGHDEERVPEQEG